MHLELHIAVTVFFLLIGISASEARRNSFSYAYNVHSLANLTIFDLTLFEELEAIRESPALDFKTRQLLESYLEDFKETHGFDQSKISSLDPAEVAANPISVYRLMRRCHLMAPKIIQEAGVNNELKLPDAVVNFPLPTENDLEEAIGAIIRIQSSYRMNVTQFASGNIFGSVGPSRLRGVHCVELGDRALEDKMFAAAYEWFQEAKRLATLDPTALPEILIEEKINRTMELHDALWYENMHDGYHPGYPGNLILFGDSLKSSPNLDENPKIRDVLRVSARDRFDHELNHVALCSEKDLKTPQEAAGHFCWLEFKIHAEYMIGPLKMEFLNRYPPIVQIHNAFFPAETDSIIASAHSLQRSMYDVNGKLRTRTPERTSTTANLSPSFDLNFRRKIERLVHVNVVGPMSGKPSLINSYTAGGYCFHHHDHDLSGSRFSTLAGNRLMTFMAYLNTVNQGGNTVFPMTLTYAKPIRGSAVFWFNVFSDGSLDYALYHIACPVIRGEKWIATKWVRMYDQFLKKQCPLKPKERFQVPVNGQYLPLPQEIRKIWKKIDGETY